MAIQIHHFETGGFVAHRVVVPGSKLIWSIWVDKYGNPDDAEGKDKNGRYRGMNNRGEVRKALHDKAASRHLIYGKKEE